MFGFFPNRNSANFFTGRCSHTTQQFHAFRIKLLLGQEEHPKNYSKKIVPKSGCRSKIKPTDLPLSSYTPRQSGREAIEEKRSVQGGIGIRLYPVSIAGEGIAIGFIDTRIDPTHPVMLMIIPIIHTLFLLLIYLASEVTQDFPYSAFTSTLLSNKS